MSQFLPAHVDATGANALPGKYREQQLASLSRSAVIEESGSPTLIKATMFMIALAVLGFVGWAAVTPISEVTRTQGDIIPKSHVRVIQHMDGGVISSINAQERMHVKTGDLLMQLDGTGARQDLAELQASRNALLLKSERLSAFVDNRLPDFSDIDAKPEDVQRERIAYDSMINNASDEEQVIRQQLAQKMQSISILNAQAANYQRNLALSQHETNSYQALQDKGLTTESRMIEARRRLSDSQGQLSSTIGEREQARSSITEYEQRLKTLVSQRREEALNDLIAAKTELAQANERMNKLQERVARLDIRSPIDGVVKGITVRSVGSVVQPGETLFEIVPTSDTLVADIRIAPKDIGNVYIGQPVRVKIGSYDFSRYGALDGTLDLISANTFTDDKGSKYFAGTVTLASAYIAAGGKQLALLPGMSVEADIITGQKTVLGYLLKPVRIAMDGAMTEK